MRCPVLLGARPISLLALVGSAACASTATPTQRDESTFIPGAGTLTLTAGPAPFVKVLAAPIDQVWRAMPTAYDSLSIPLSVIDPKMHVIGNEGFKVRQKLGSARMSSYIECGTTQVGPNADSYEVFLTVITQAEAKGPMETRVTTTITAAAKPMQYSQGYSRCSTKDVLEARIIAVINAQLRR